MKKLRILLADDHTLVRQGLRRILEEKPEWEVVAEAHDGREAVLRAVELNPDIVIMDITMPRLNGTEATRQITRKAPDVRVLVLSMHMDESYVLQTLRAGARGYLLKDSVDTDLVRAVTAVNEGKSFFSPSVAKMMLDDYIRHLEQQGVTDRFELLAERDFPVDRGGKQQQGYRKPAFAQHQHGGNAPLAHHGETGPPQHDRNHSLCRPEGRSFLRIKRRSGSDGSGAAGF